LPAAASATILLGMDLGALLDSGQLDRAMVERLRDADRDKMREMLSKYHDDDAVERFMARIEALVSTLPPR
jgi:hypothetical protein